MFLPVTCGACGRPGPSPCPRCWEELRPGGPVHVPGLDACLALLAYEGPARELVARLKYRNARAGVGWLARGMADLAAPHAPDLVAWVPTTAARRRARGFDQAEVLARAVARRLRVPAAELLRRAAGAPQTGRSRAERVAGPRLHPSPSCGRATGRRLLLVDDVVTTGASLAAAASALAPARPSGLIGVAAAHRR